MIMVIVIGTFSGCIPSPFYYWSLEAKPGVYHQVKPGQTLWRIASTYQVPLEEIVRSNGLKDATRIRVGQRIFIPGATELLTVEVVRSDSPANRIVSVQERELEDEPGDEIVNTSSQEKVLTSFIWPVNGPIISPFGLRNGRRHSGVDIKAPSGSPIRAIADGRVTYSSSMNGYGNVIIITHDYDLTSLYAHNEVNLVAEGDEVVQGQIIGYVGQTGRASTPHLHLEIWEGVVAKNPQNYLP